MKIDYISSDGIHRAEKDALERMRQVFNQSPFSQGWHGYAGFELIDRTLGDREIDLVLLTHDRLLLIELKNWHGIIRPVNDHWLLNNNDMGRSPVKVTSLKAKILSGKMKTRLAEPARSVWNEHRVILCGEADTHALPQEERDYTVRLDDFLKISREGTYTKYFGAKKSIRPIDHIAVFNSFFRGPEFKPTSFSFNNFQIDGDAIFAHPDHLYEEYRAVKQDDRRLQALLRRWDFSSLAGLADTKDERSKIGLREQRVLAYIQENSDEVYANLFQPLAFPTRDNVDADFCELYRLPPRQQRLSAFINRYRDVLAPAERLGLVKVFTSHVADLHDLGVAHRDVGDHTIWLERPSKASISGLVAAFFPEAGTVGGLQAIIRAGAVVLPEDSEDIGSGTPTDAFRRDVYLLGIAAHHLFYLKPPEVAEGLDIFVWRAPSEDPFAGAFNAWLEKAMDIVPGDRFANAREMLNALNQVNTLEEGRSEIAMRDFQAYESEVPPMDIYPLEEVLRRGRVYAYRSSLGDKSVCVKTWYKARPDMSRPADNHRLLDFLNSVRLLKAQPCQTVPEILDFGISPAGTFVVTEWINGVPLDGYQPGELAETLRLCKSVVDAVIQLHSLQLAHGDLSPEHIFISDGKPRFIDLVDFFPEGGIEPHNLAYGPPESEEATREERDCYATAKICSELLAASTKDPSLDLGPLYSELAACLTREFDVYRLDKVQIELDRALAPPTAPITIFKLKLRRLADAFSMPSDNGAYHIGIVEDSKSHDNVLLRFTGIRMQILIAVKKETRQPAWVKHNELPHSQFVRQANRAIAQLTGSIELEPATADDSRHLANAALAIPSVNELFEELAGTRQSSESTPEISRPEAPSPSTQEIWRSILRAEETTLPEVEVAAPPLWDLDASNRLHVRYSKEGPPLDYPDDEVIKVVQESDGEFQTIGNLNTKDTSTDVLVIDRVDRRFSGLQIGDQLKFQSTSDRASIQKRKAATLRISEKQSVIPNLVEYFDPALSTEPTRFDDPPTDADFQVYDVYREGKLKFSLNSQQRDAFRTLWSSGPLSLLQGPPGTGKTAFIASFIHYALKKGARQILLASQSHEAVNNAAEKVLDLSHRTKTPINLVRFGGEGFVSDALLPFHVNSILHEYRELFRVEMRERLSGLAQNLGLPKAYVEEWWALQANLGALTREIGRLRTRCASLRMDGATARLQDLERKREKREERFSRIAADQFGVLEGDPAEIMTDLENALGKRYGIASPDAVARLKRLGVISQEWIDRLATLRANFEEFLAKTRSLVCGTCVGLGRAEFGVVTNKYDWVIIDEAARATPGELAVAMQTARRVLLVGDHRQLPPLYTQEVANRISADFPSASPSMLIRSDFERAFESAYGKAVGATLQVQYRMAPAIGALVSECFYPSPLIPGRGPSPEIYQALPIGARATVNWIDTTRAGRTSWERPKQNSGFDNEYECRVILSLLRAIAGKGNLLDTLASDVQGDDRPIGIICTYREQMFLLQPRVARPACDLQDAGFRMERRMTESWCGSAWRVDWSHLRV